MARTTVAQLSTQVSELANLVSQVLGTAVHATPAAVVEAVAPVVVTPVAPAVIAAGDKLKDFVEAQGLAFARGGRVLLTTAALQAAVRVLKTGTPEVLPVEGVGNLDKRSITAIAIGRSNDGKSVLTQYVYSPAAE